jgi:hypothetical protein
MGKVERSAGDISVDGIMSKDSSINGSFSGSHSVILDEDLPENFEPTEQGVYSQRQT